MMTARRGDFTFRQLSTFVAAARSGSFALAADQLGISQPAVSDHISALEAHLGHPLFERRRGTTSRLTHHGVDMLHHAESLLRTSKAMRGHDEAGAVRTHIRVSMGPRLRELYLKPMLSDLYAENPGLEIELVPVVRLRDVPASLEKGDIDLLLYTVGRVPEGFHVRDLADVPILLVGSPEHAARVKSGRESLEDLHFILHHDSMVNEQWLEQQLAEAGVSPRPPIRYVEFTDVIQSMVESGLGVSVLPSDQVRHAILAGKLVPLGPALPPMKRILVRAPNAPPGADLLERKLVEAMRDHPV